MVVIMNIIQYYKNENIFSYLHYCSSIGMSKQYRSG